MKRVMQLVIKKVEGQKGNTKGQCKRVVNFCNEQKAIKKGRRVEGELKRVIKKE